MANLKSDRERLVGDCLISASFLSYTGAFSWDFRRQMVYEDWEVDLRSRNVPLSKPFRLEKTLANDLQIIRQDCHFLKSIEPRVCVFVCVIKWILFRSTMRFQVDIWGFACRWAVSSECNTDLSRESFPAFHRSTATSMVSYVYVILLNTNNFLFWLCLCYPTLVHKMSVL